VEKESTNKLASSSIRRTLLIFLVGGFILHFVEIMVLDVCDTVWIDFLHYNPHRSQADALYLMAQSPITALLATLLYAELPVIVSAIVAMISYRIWGNIPLFSLAVMLPLCVFALYIQIPSGPMPFDYTGFLWLSLKELPVLVGCWWWSNRTIKS